jgi:hypothetical protein
MRVNVCFLLTDGCRNLRRGYANWGMIFTSGGRRGEANEEYFD